MLKIVIGMGELLWHEKFAHTLDEKIASGYPIQYSIINIDRGDWIEKIHQADAVIWKPTYMYPRFAGYFKEKIYFMEMIMGKLVMPNYDTIWHFDSKIAQSYLFEHLKIPTPDTFISFDYKEAVESLSDRQYPLVYKDSHGASSKNVRLINNYSEIRKIINHIFVENKWLDLRTNHTKFKVILKSFFNGILWNKVKQKVFREEPFGVFYCQELIGNNPADLRINVIGDCYALGFWRNNRPNDFRASGSGRIDYRRSLPMEIIKYCLQINKKFNFDSMAYDIIFKNGQFVITEMSYGYKDKAVYDIEGYYELLSDGQIIYKSGHRWPQEIWIDWLMRRMQKKYGDSFKIKAV